MTKLQISKYMSYLLRHHPEAAGLHMDERGWVAVPEFLDALNKRWPVSLDDLKEIVRTDDKQRYSFSKDGSARIRANQGHSIQVNVELAKKEPPEILYHGTGLKYVESIDEQGLVPKTRLYVHLSKDLETARIVGRRHGEPFIYLVHAGKMYRDGYPFFVSENGIWLTKEVPKQYLEHL